MIVSVVIATRDRRESLAATLSALGAGGARVAVRENIGQSHFAIITPGNPIHDAHEPAMLAVLKGR